MAEPKEYTFKGTVELSGATFFVTAENEEDARRKAKRGEWDHYEADTAECINATLHVDTCEDNS